MVTYYNQRDYRRYLRSVIDRFKSDLANSSGIDLSDYTSGFPEERQAKIEDMLERILLKYYLSQPDVLKLIENNCESDKIH